MTSSSLTHTNNTAAEVDPDRIGSTIGLNNLGIVAIDWQNESLDLQLLQADNSGMTSWWGHAPAGDLLKQVSIQFGSRRTEHAPWWKLEHESADCASSRPAWTDPIMD